MFEDQIEEEQWSLSDAQDHEFIPLISAEDEEAMQKEEVPEDLPLLSLRNTVLFPGVVIPITTCRIQGKVQSAPTPPVGAQRSCQPTVNLHILPPVWDFPLGKG